MRARCCRDSRHTASSSRSTSLQMPQLLQCNRTQHGTYMSATILATLLNQGNQRSQHIPADAAGPAAWMQVSMVQPTCEPQAV